MPVRVILTVPWGARLGGAEAMLWTFLQGVDRARISPHVVFFQPGPFERDVAGIGLGTTVIPAGRLRQTLTFGRTISALTAFLRREQPDVIVNWSSKTQVYGSLAATWAQMPGRLVWWQHASRPSFWLDRLATCLPARAIGCSSEGSARAQERVRPRRRTFVVHPGVDPAEDDGQTRAQDRRALRIPESSVVIGTIGRLQPLKGQDRFIRTLARLRQRGLDVHGLIVGGDAYELSPGYAAGLRPLAEGLGVSEYLTLTGHVTDPLPYLRVMDVMVSASTSESFGIGMLEAMAAGVPVVAVAVEGLADMIDSGCTGVLVPSADPESLADGTRLLIEDRNLRERLSIAAREQVVSKFSSAAMIESLTSQLEALGAGTF